MPKLSFTTDDGEELKYRLDVAKVTIGRSEENLIVISDASLSGLHAELLEEGGNYRLTDLDSTNGTKVNGKSIKEELLQDGDSVQFGNLVGSYSSEVTSSSASETGPVHVGESADDGDDAGAADAADADAAPAAEEDPWAEDEPAAPAAASSSVTSAGRAGFGPKAKKKDPLAGVLITLAVVALLACAVAAFLATQMHA